MFVVKSIDMNNLDGLVLPDMLIEYKEQFNYAVGGEQYYTRIGLGVYPLTNRLVIIADDEETTVSIEELEMILSKAKEYFKSTE
jgi:hypothetical protein